MANQVVLAQFLWRPQLLTRLEYPPIEGGSRGHLHESLGECQ